MATWMAAAASIRSSSSTALKDPALERLALIVHGADVVADREICPEAAGLYAIARGFALVQGEDDHRKVELGCQRFVSLELRGDVQLPRHLGPGGFDHGDIHASTGRVFIAHTANGTIEVVDGERLEHLATINGCAEASGVLCPPSTDLVIAAARGSGSVLFIDPAACAVTGTVEVGGKPNGLAWDAHRRRVLVADVAGNSVSIVDPIGGRIVSTGSLPGRPRWTVHDLERDQFLVNIREPPMVAVVDSETAAVIETWPTSSAGPHGLDLDICHGRAFVACDAGQLICLDLNDGSELAGLKSPVSPTRSGATLTLLRSTWPSAARASSRWSRRTR